MHIDSYFSLANSYLDDAEFVILGIPYDATQSFIPGSRFLPNAVREASWNLESYSTFFNFDLDDVRVCDAGNINVDGGFNDVIRRVEEFYQNLHAIPIAIGGEHTISYACSKNFDDACYIAFDAHFDLRDEFDGNKFNHACTIRRICERVDDVVVIGVRSGTKEEREFADENLQAFYAWDVIENGIEWVVESVEFDRIYLSIDMDVFDPAFATVSTPEPFGLHPMHLLKFMQNFDGKIVGLDVVEAIPDQSKKTQTLVAKIIFEFIASQ
ncbi:agmatinase [Archaeoglobales archaeon]|nr:MAG: agmatinase [Archaeoglobales archaeon]